ncbi:hypothetical protein [Bacillus sp. DNRA2]|nr:hypothetical protein [Bacillus sp. DNRA2]
MAQAKKPLLSDEFLEELANEINEQFGKPKETQEKQKDSSKKDKG